MPEWVNNNGIVLYLQIGIIILLVVLIIIQHLRLRAVSKQLEHYQHLMEDYDDGNVEQIMMEMKSDLDQKSNDLQKMIARVSIIEEQLPKMVQSIGVMRFKGFEDVGGDLSFSTSILTGQGDGVVITALHSRDDTRVYAKKIDKYISAYPLSEEEINVIKQSKKR